MKNDDVMVNCPYCDSDDAKYWAEERGWKVVRCLHCRYLYVNPRPSLMMRNLATEFGTHASGGNLDISERRVGRKVALYRQALQTMFSDLWSSNRPVISWIDIGAGYGEMAEAVKSLAHPNSKVIGLEPMLPKVLAARAMGLEMISGYIDHNTPKCQFASAINIFSHIYDFDHFLCSVRDILEEGGDLLIETGDMSNVESREQLPGELGLPDHVAFASEEHLTGFLSRNGFKVISVQHIREDNLIYFMKNTLKRLVGRDVVLSLPFSSPYRSIRIRARKLPLMTSTCLDRESSKRT